MEVVFLSAAISFIAGTALGMIAAFWGGVIRNVIQFTADFTLIIPSFIMAMVFSALFGFKPAVAGIVFGIGNMGEYVNQSYNLAYSLKKQEFIDAERIIGLGRGRILVFHVLPNICRQLFVFLGNKAANVVVQYSGLAFIGLGTDITKPDWGTLLYQYRIYMISHPTLVIYPAAAITLLTVFFHVMFDSGSEGGERVTLYD
jgi:peptide/nickel transport system permease protein